MSGDGYLDPAWVRARRNARGQLVVIYLPEPESKQVAPATVTAEGVRPVRAFPFTAPGEQIVLIDAQDREIGVLRDLSELDAESRAAIETELELVYLVPRVQSIRSVRSRFGVTTWDLETDRGPRVAHVKERTDIRPLPDGRTILTDVHGVQYEIPPREELDERSRFWLDLET